MTAALKSAVTIRPLKTDEELRATIPLQRAIWGYTDLDCDSAAILTIASKFTGQVLGAFDGEHLIGFSFALSMLEAGHLHSHRVGVLPDYQNQGTGRKLKLAQREYALGQNIRVIQWTFDPLQPRNAHFNIARLGVVSKHYLPNFYGITSSPLHGGLPTDRLLAKWHLTSHRVRTILSGSPPAVSANLREIRIILSDLNEDRSAVQVRIRNEFLHCFRHGYVVGGFRQEEDSYCYELAPLAWNEIYQHGPIKIGEI